MRHIFIINPTSGKGKGLIVSKIIDEYLKNKSIDYKIIYTKDKDDAKNIVKDFNCFNDLIYSVGGDGTLNEVINGMAYSNSSLCVVPAGSGNDFYKSIKGINYNIDLGSVNDRYFINIASLGLDANIASYANELKKYKVSSDLIYILSLIKNYFIFNGTNLTINSDNKDITILTVCNAKYYGGGFKIAPNAILNDGLFDIYEVEKLNKINTLKVLVKLLKGTHEKDKSVKFYRTDNININSSLPLCCNVDGEIIYDTDFNFKLHKNAIKLNMQDNLRINELLKVKRLIK